VLTAASEVAECVADGYARYTHAEQRQMYRAAKRALYRVETQLAVLRHADLLTVAAHGELATRIQSVHRVLAGYLVYLDRQLQDERERAAS
jgi:four helix bundle protein